MWFLRDEDVVDEKENVPRTRKIFSSKIYYFTVESDPRSRILISIGHEGTRLARENCDVHRSAESCPSKPNSSKGRACGDIFSEAKSNVSGCGKKRSEKTRQKSITYDTRSRIFLFMSSFSFPTSFPLTKLWWAFHTLVLSTAHTSFLSGSNSLNRLLFPAPFLPNIKRNFLSRVNFRLQNDFRLNNQKQS